MKIKSVKQIYFIFAIISLLIAGIVTLFIKHNNLPYNFRIDQKKSRSSSKSVRIYKDLNNNGISEEISLFRPPKPVNDYIDVYKDNNVIIDQINTFAHSDPNWIYNEDYNNDGYDEIFMFSQLGDSLFLSVFDLKADEYILNRQFIMSKPDSARTKATKTWDIQARPFKLLKSKKDRYSKLIFIVDAGYAIYPRGVYAYDIKKKKITEKYEIGAGIKDMLFADINSDGENEIILSTRACGNMEKETGIHDHDKWLIVLNKHLKPVFTPISFGGFSGNSYPFIVNTDSTKNILVFYHYNTKFLNSILFNSKGEKLNSLNNFPNNTKHPIKVIENGKDIIYITDFNGKLIKADSKLRIIKTKDSYDNNILFVPKINLVLNNQHVLLARGTDNIYLISKSLDILAKVNFDDNLAPLFLFVKLNGKNKPVQLAFTSSLYNYLFSIVENKLYSYLPLIFIAAFLIPFFLMYAFHSILTFFSTYAKYFSYSLNRSSKGVALLNSSGKVFYSNNNFSEFLKLSKSIAKMMHYKDIFTERKSILFALEEAIKHQRKTQKEIQISSPTHQFEGEMTITPFTSFIGFTYAYLIEISDYTEALLTDRGKVWGATLQRIAHEIKTPLSGINLGLDTLAQRLSKKTDKYEPDIVRIKNEVNRIKALTKNFLLFSNMEKPQFTKVQLSRLLNESVSVFESYLKSGIELEIQPSDYVILGDEIQLKQLFHIIIENAIDACGGQGRIKIKIKIKRLKTKKSEKAKGKSEKTKGSEKAKVRSEKLEGNAFLEISITDNGKGISDEDLSKIFEPYYTTKKDGTGIGLAIAKKIVEDHNGKIEIESKLGEGTTVCFYLIAA